ncbi:cation diffusion facilitator family transporter [Defluviimonas sp. 20V17]|uniref:Cation efflux system protein n=1 Tax=Allgaiera indica TaxID=765699 RepID=A0AAN4UP54_9RHOB|nr:cation diffusion facilitator family transporter [Allgaiera indica]KDB05581.1 cation diffusion facilitator family transporter [Defluviimonas sp. 20V17]GHD98990.1 cation efflux system protein [Allgaiera indica]SDW02225.1 cobalt-zinc-cadmium efflux system protein [Allgaiera indica]
MPHDHHHHHHVDPEAGDGRVALAVAVNLILTVAQIAGGIFSGSVALIADAIHNFSDALTLVIAYAARRIARRPADATMTFGYGRAEVVAAMVNYTSLILISIWLAGEAMLRLFHPPQVEGGIVVVLAGLALIVDLATATLTYAMSKNSMNIRAAFLHNLADAATSVAVIVSGGLIMLFDWRLADPIVTLAISGWILWHAVREIGPAIRILMLGAPPEIEAKALIARIGDVEGISGVHHLHLWQIDEHETSIEVHLVVEDAGAEVEVRRMLNREFGIHHATLQVEAPGDTCEAPCMIGHAAR